MSIDIKKVPIEISAYYQDDKTSGVSVTLSEKIFGSDWPGVALNLIKAMENSMVYHESAENQNEALDDSLNQLNDCILDFNKRYFDFAERPLNAILSIDLNSREEILDFITYVIVFLTTIYPLEKFARIPSDNYNGIVIAYQH